MVTPNNVKEVFFPLSQRLTYYQFETYVENARAYITPEGEQLFPYNQLIGSLLEQVTLFEPREIVKEAEKYLQIVNFALANLKETTQEFIQYGQVNPDAEMDEWRATTPQRKEELFQQHQEELQSYQSALEKVIQVQKNLSSPTPDETAEHHNLSTAQQVVIDISGRPSVRLLRKNFKPRLELVQVVFLLSYLRDKGIIPNYTASALGWFGTYLFGWNQKDVKDSINQIGQLEEQKKKELKALKKILEEVLGEIDRAIKR